MDLRTAAPAPLPSVTPAPAPARVPAPVPARTPAPVSSPTPSRPDSIPQESINVPNLEIEIPVVNNIDYSDDNYDFEDEQAPVQVKDNYMIKTFCLTNIC